MPHSVPAAPLTCPTTFPLPGSPLTPARAREIAVELVMLADATEGYRGPHGFVVRWEVLAEVETLRQEVEHLRERVTTQLDAGAWE